MRDFSWDANGYDQDVGPLIVSRFTLLPDETPNDGSPALPLANFQSLTNVATPAPDYRATAIQSLTATPFNPESTATHLSLAVEPAIAAHFGIVPRFSAPAQSHDSAPAISHEPPVAQTGGLVINVTYDASVATNPNEAAFKACVAGVVQYYESKFNDPITINFAVGWGEVAGQAIAGGAGAESVSVYTPQQYSYAQIKAALTADAKTADDQTALASLAATDPTGGGTFSMTTAEAKALGLMGASAALDGSTGLDATSSWVYNTTNTAGGNVPDGSLDAFSFFAHELSEIMGRQMNFGNGSGDAAAGDGFYPEDLFDFKAAGVRSFTGSDTRYFSFNGGVTNIHNFNSNAGGDLFDWAVSATPDSYDWQGSVGLVSAGDLQVMDVLGYDPVGASGQPDLTASGLAASLTLASFTIANGGTASAAASTAGLYLSTDTTITTADVLLGSAATPALAAGANSAENVALSFTGAQTPGTYYLGVVADRAGAVAESNETNNASNAVPVILGDNNGNTITGTAGNDLIFGLAGADAINSGSGNDKISGGLGADLIYFAVANLTSADTVDGGADASLDRLVFTTAGTIAASAFQNVSHIEQLILANGTNNLTVPDALVASADDGHILYVTGGTGNDTVNASALTSLDRAYITAGSGNDTLTGGLGLDIFYFAAADLTSGDTVNGGTGTSADVLALTTAGTVAAAAFQGVSHVEEVVLANGTNNVTFTDALVSSADDGHVLYAIGGTGNDTINAGAVTTAANRIYFFGGAGNDVLAGGAGADDFFFTAANLTAADTVNGGTGTSVDSILFTTAGTVAASAFTNVSHIEQLYLAATGSSSVTLSDALVTGADDNHILHVTGGTGADTINAAAVTTATNRVVFIGGGGADVMTAGAGADIFAYLSAADSTSTGYDTITGFSYAADRFDITGGAGTITAVEAARNGALDSGVNFDTELAARFSTLAGHHSGLITASSGTLSGQTFLVIDLNGTTGYQSGADLVLHLVSPTGTLVTGDFV